jgi:hypothetical protein
MTDDEVRLEIESQRTAVLRHSVEDVYIPLAIAAGIVFHQAHPGAASSVSRQDYEGALDLAAAALSRLIPVYVMRDPPGERATLMVDLTHARFARGAIELRVRGETVGELSVARSDLLSAVSLIKRTGLPFSFGGPTRL